jgi:transposase
MQNIAPVTEQESCAKESCSKARGLWEGATCGNLPLLSWSSVAMSRFHNRVARGHHHLPAAAFAYGGSTMWRKHVWVMSGNLCAKWLSFTVAHEG